MQRKCCVCEAVYGHKCPACGSAITVQDPLRKTYFYCNNLRCPHFLTAFDESNSQPTHGYCPTHEAEARRTAAQGGQGPTAQAAPTPAPNFDEALSVEREMGAGCFDGERDA